MPEKGKYSKLIAEWQRFYKEVFGIKADFSKIVLPGKRKGFNWLLIMAAGLTANRLFDKCKEHFTSWKYRDDLNTVISVRKTDKTYAIWLRDRIEADKENKNLSAKECEKRGINGITLEERLVMELFYNWNRPAGKHLDINNVTLCSGSCDSDGGVPGVGWGGGGLYIGCCDPGSAGDILRARSVVS
ncbi:MAG: hypothetical protein PHC97_02385 [Patescibacteria group bacterium]|nr:hypothetical protein [Patescibacteria group bacterium]